MYREVYILMLHLKIGGVEICSINLANSLAKRGYKVTLISVLKSNEFENTNIKYPIPYFTSVLQEKEKKLTGKEITKTQLRRYEIEKQMG